MASYGLCLVLVLAVQTCAVYGQEEIVKRSLTLIVDDSLSMSDVVQQLRLGVHTVFGRVSSSSASQIENFVLVTFNDPDAVVRIVTKDRNEFESALEAISVHGGDDCPEYALKGIELGLTASLPHSYLYVFTDASAKDYNKFEQIKSIAQEKQSQLNFILTGSCGSEGADDIQVYYKLAEATNGRVFYVKKETDVKDISKYVEDSLVGRGVNVK